MSSDFVKEAEESKPICGAWHLREAMQVYVKDLIPITMVAGYLHKEDKSILELQDFICDNLKYDWMTASGVIDAGEAIVKASIENGLLRKAPKVTKKKKDG